MSDKRCGFCRKEEDVTCGDFIFHLSAAYPDRKIVLNVGYDNNQKWYGTQDEVDLQINFCRMCGTKLNEAEK